MGDQLGLVAVVISMLAGALSLLWVFSRTIAPALNQKQMSDSRYVITIRALGKFPELEIDEPTYQDLKQSKATLDHALALEEKYEILLGNYRDFEQKLLDIATSNMIQRPSGYQDVFDYRLAINTKIVNLLTSARLYLDHMATHTGAILPNDEESLIKVKEHCSTEYDQNLQYRFMEALRNYVQHKGLAVHFTTLQSGWVGEGDSKQLRYNIQVYANRDRLSEDKKFKAAVLAQIPERVDLKFAARSYVESLSAIHIGVRNLVQKSVEAARQTIEAARDQYAEIHDGDLMGLGASVRHQQGEMESVNLVLEWDDIRRRLQQQNVKLSNLSKRYVTSKSS